MLVHDVLCVVRNVGEVADKLVVDVECEIRKGGHEARRDERYLIHEDVVHVDGRACKVECDADSRVG